MHLFFQSYGQGPPLIILHGLLGASGNWHTLNSRVFAQHFEVFALDQRNHGRSPHSPVFDYPTLAADVRDFMDQQGIIQAHLLGHSMGGKTAMQFALTCPDRLQKLIVVDIAPRAYAPRHTVIFDALRSLDLTRLGSRKEIDDALATTIPEAAVRQFLMKNLERDGQGAYRWKMNLDALYQNYDQISRGLAHEGSYEGPTLFVRGGRSDYIQDTDRDTILHHFPKAEHITIPEAGHWVHAEAPGPFADAVLSFLR